MVRGNPDLGGIYAKPVLYRTKGLLIVFLRQIQVALEATSAGNAHSTPIHKISHLTPDNIDCKLARLALKRALFQETRGKIDILTKSP